MNSGVGEVGNYTMFQHHECRGAEYKGHIGVKEEQGLENIEQPVFLLVRLEEEMYLKQKTIICNRMMKHGKSETT